MIYHPVPKFTEKVVKEILENKLFVVNIRYNVLSMQSEIIFTNKAGTKYIAFYLEPKEQGE